MTDKYVLKLRRKHGDNRPDIYYSSGTWVQTLYFKSGLQTETPESEMMKFNSEKEAKSFRRSIYQKTHDTYDVVKLPTTEN